MEPMTTTIQAQAIQSSLAEIDLTDRMGRGNARDLCTELENLLWKIQQDEWAEEERQIDARQADRERYTSHLQKIADSYRVSA